jgi:pimeloyl-ACP methyl ester carboxylesterase
LRREPDRVDELAAAGVPLLVACGVEDDAWSPAIQEEMAHRLGAEFVAIPGAQHSPAVENPDETARILLDFWSTVDEHD